MFPRSILWPRDDRGWLSFALKSYQKALLLASNYTLKEVDDILELKISFTEKKLEPPSGF